MTSAPARTRPLAKVLEQGEHAKDLVDQCASDLAAVNTGIRLELEGTDAHPAIEEALKQNETAEAKVQEASEELASVNGGLAVQLRDHNLLEHQFAAAVEQRDAALHVALHDGLTELPNRALFNDRLEHGLAQAKRHDWKLAVMYIDLDGFKQINDLHGHDIGDRLLQTVAQRLKDGTRADDTVSRYGGDEFLHLLMEIRDSEQVALIARKLLDLLQAPCSLLERDVGDQPVIRASIGIALFPQHGTDPESLIKRADEAMYKAKRAKCGIAFAT